MFSVAQSPEPIKFRGAYIGEPLPDFVNCDSGKAKAIKDGYKTHGKLCQGEKGSVWRLHGHFANAKREGETFTFDNRTLIRITIMIPNDDWEKVKYDLTQKLGEPQSEVPDVYQNGFGARWEFNQGFWLKDSTVAYAGIKVLNIGGRAIDKPFSNQPDTQGIEITITDSVHAKLPDTTTNSLD
ncbi:MAG TPA: hypothetical protein VGL74_10950 [Terriglobales bacterium]